MGVNFLLVGVIVLRAAGWSAEVAEEGAGGLDGVEEEAETAEVRPAIPGGIPSGTPRYTTATHA